MCTRPLRLESHSVYFDKRVSQYFHEVPCGVCEECREAQKNEWCTRLQFEISHYAKIGGKVIFLTFTYNEMCIPTLELLDEDCVESVKCFNGDDILKFLDMLNSKVQYQYGKKKYKYFICSEYGKYTRRPHYHGCFFLHPDIDYKDFTELCRELWTKGYTFPKYDKRRKMYVDNEGCSSSPLLKGFIKDSGISLEAGARYVSKYVTKDMSYYELNPVLMKFYNNKSWRKANRKYLPKHWQSKGIGYSIFENIDLSKYEDVVELIDKGVRNPLTISEKNNNRISLPQYVINKLLYYNVKSDRISETTGKPLYDRKRTDFGMRYLPVEFERKVRRQCLKMSDVFQQSSAFENYEDVLKELNKMKITDLSNPDSFVPVAMYHVIYKSLTPHFIGYFRENYGRFPKVFDLADATKVYSLAKDCETAERIGKPSDLFTRQKEIRTFSTYSLLYRRYFGDVSLVEDRYCLASRHIAELKAQKRAEKENKKQKLKYLYKGII